MAPQTLQSSTVKLTPLKNISPSITGKWLFDMYDSIPYIKPIYINVFIKILRSTVSMLLQIFAIYR